MSFFSSSSDSGISEARALMIKFCSDHFQVVKSERKIGGLAVKSERGDLNNDIFEVLAYLKTSQRQRIQLTATFGLRTTTAYVNYHVTLFW